MSLCWYNTQSPRSRFRRPTRQQHAFVTSRLLSSFSSDPIRFNQYFDLHSAVVQWLCKDVKANILLSQKNDSQSASPMRVTIIISSNGNNNSSNSCSSNPFSYWKLILTAYCRFVFRCRLSYDSLLTVFHALSATIVSLPSWCFREVALVYPKNRPRLNVAGKRGILLGYSYSVVRLTSVEPL